MKAKFSIIIVSANAVILCIDSDRLLGGYWRKLIPQILLGRFIGGESED